MDEEEQDLLLKIMEPYHSSIEDWDFNGNTLCNYLHSEGEVVLYLHIEGGWVYLYANGYDYRERGEDRDPEVTDLLKDKYWELSKPGTIELLHKEINEFIKTFHKECIKNLTERLDVYKDSVEERENARRLETDPRSSNGQT